MAEHHVPDGRQLDLAGATGAVEERLAERLLECRDLLADGGLGEAEALRRLAERLLGSDGAEGREMADREVVEHVGQCTSEAPSMH